MTLFATGFAVSKIGFYAKQEGKAIKSAIEILEEIA